MKTDVTTQMEILFFAYQGTREHYCDNNVDSIKRAISDYNIHQKSIRAMTWEDLKKSGGFIDKEILQSISDAEYFACDLTYLNHNVLFELGYAIALNKKIFIFLNEEIENAKLSYQNFFLKSIKYTPFKNSKDYISKLKNKFSYNDKYIQELTETLFKNSYLVAFDKTSKSFYTTYKELETGLAKRRFFILPHNILLFVNNPYISYANMTPKRMFRV